MDTDRRRERWLVLRAQSGDRRALGQLLEGVQAPLFRYVRSLVGERALAQDVLQDVLWIVCRKLGTLREPDLFRAWAYRVASREAFRQLKRQRRLPHGLDEAAYDAEGVRAFEGALTLEVKAQLGALVERAVPPASRAVLQLYYFHDLSLVEVANALDVPLGTVKSRLAYGLHCLRRELGVAKAEQPENPKKETP